MEANKEPEKIPASPTKSFSRRQWKILIIFACVYFFAASVVSIQAPFFPDVATSKGASLIEVGVVFGAFQVTLCVMSPLISTKVERIGPKRLFSCGIFCTGTMCGVFGCLNFIHARIPFIISSIVVQMISAVGEASFIVACITIIAVEFPENTATTMGCMETFYGFGIIAGPTMGGILYEVGGYFVPFWVLGSGLLICATLTMLCLPKIGDAKKGEKLTTMSAVDMFKLIRHPEIFVSAFSIISGAVGMGFIANNLAQHVEHSHSGLNKFYVGAIFMLSGGVHAMSSPLWGRLCDTAKNPKIYILIGSCLGMIGFSILGPLPFLPVEPSLWSIAVALVICGTSSGALYVIGFIIALQDSLILGYPDGISTYGLVSGMWTCTSSFGYFVGAVGGGVLYDLVGFRYGTLMYIAVQLVLMAMLVMSFKRAKKNNEPPSKAVENGSSSNFPSTPTVEDAL